MNYIGRAIRGGRVCSRFTKSPADRELSRIRRGFEGTAWVDLGPCDSDGNLLPPEQAKARPTGKVIESRIMARTVPSAQKAELLKIVEERMNRELFTPPSVGESEVLVRNEYAGLY